MHPNRLFGLRTPHNQADETAIRDHRAATHESRAKSSTAKVICNRHLKIISVLI